MQRYVEQHGVHTYFVDHAVLVRAFGEEVRKEEVGLIDVTSLCRTFYVLARRCIFSGNGT